MPYLTDRSTLSRARISNIRPATLDDVQGISQLLAKYYIGRLSEAQRARGFISVEFTEPELHAMVLEPGIAIGVAEDNQVVAVAGSSPIPSHGGRGVFQKIDELIDQMDYNCKRLSQYRLFMYGPVCVDEACGGQGLSGKLWQCFVDMVRGRYDVGLAFVSLANAVSLKAHREKLSMTQVCEFEAEGRRYALLAFGVLD